MFSQVAACEPECPEVAGSASAGRSGQGPPRAAQPEHAVGRSVLPSPRVCIS